ncbi:MAG: ATP-binding protein, partial [Tenericutes bacterium]|nr:ATP-binding protein [Mycoplasmatota bacterium]
YESKRFEFGIIHGRRRVGKTTLLKHSIMGKKALYLLAQQANAKVNLEIFSKIYGNYKGVGQIIYESFGALFKSIFQEPDLIVIIDEFTYLTEVDPSVESILQGLIDTYKDNSTIKLLISGSEIGMFENIFSHSKPLFGRQTFSYHLKECDYLESSLYFQKYINEDRIKAYAIFGGLPYYLAQIDDCLSIKENVCRLIIDESARFAYEVQMILNSELRSIQEYQSVLQAIQSGNTKLSQIDSKSKINNTAKTSKYVKKLTELEIIEKEIKFLETPNSKNHLFRISNNFIAFYYRFIWRNQASRFIMNSSDFYDEYIANGIDDYVSRRFEKICEQYLIRNYKRNNKESIIAIGRYWYNDRKLKTDIEIDQCVKTRNHIHIYECKWTKEKIGISVMNVLKEKGKHIEATKYGLFSKNEFHNNIKNNGFDLKSIDDLFKY